MTNEEALKLLEMHYDYQEDFDCNDELVTALAFGIQALKKQIPKKPKQKMDGTLCPCCNEIVYYSNDYCDSCGQALDWNK